MLHNAESHHRKSLRLEGHDYRRAGAYFVTVCTFGRRSLLGEVNDGVCTTSEAGRIVEEIWQSLPAHFPHLELDVFVVMPNHLHGILVLNEGEAFAIVQPETAVVGANASPLQRPRGTSAGSLGAIIQSFKSVSTRKLNQQTGTPGAPVWQRNYYEQIIRNDRSLQVLREYVANNPLRWHLDELYPGGVI